MINFSDIDFFIYTFFYIIKKKKKNRPRQVNPVRVCSLFMPLCLYVFMSQALLTDPNNSIFSLTVALIASKPGARSLRGSYPLPC